VISTKKSGELSLAKEATWKKKREDRLSENDEVEQQNKRKFRL